MVRYCTIDPAFNKIRTRILYYNRSINSTCLWWSYPETHPQVQTDAHRGVCSRILTTFVWNVDKSNLILSGMSDKHTEHRWPSNLLTAIHTQGTRPTDTVTVCVTAPPQPLCWLSIVEQRFVSRQTPLSTHGHSRGSKWKEVKGRKMKKWFADPEYSIVTKL